jgi:hypothetical protein
MNANLNFEMLFEQLPEQDLWRLLQDMIASEVELEDDTLQRLDDRMQGFLFLQEYIGNREARMEFARSPAHMLYLRDAAGSRNVWMNDDEFTELVEQDDAVTLACFARSEHMRPHHLAYIEYKLSVDPHGCELLATSSDTRITLKKALEQQGHSWEMAVFRLARAVMSGSASIANVVLTLDIQPRTLWQAYLSIRNQDESVLNKQLALAGLSTNRPVRTSRSGGESIH